MFSNIGLKILSDYFLLDTFSGHNSNVFVQHNFFLDWKMAFLNEFQIFRKKKNPKT